MRAQLIPNRGKQYCVIVHLRHAADATERDDVSGKAGQLLDHGAITYFAKPEIVAVLVALNAAPEA